MKKMISFGLFAFFSLPLYASDIKGYQAAIHAAAQDFHRSVRSGDRMAAHQRFHDQAAAAARTYLDPGPAHVTQHNYGVSTNYGGTNVNHAPSTNYGGMNTNLAPSTNYGGTNYNYAPATNRGGTNYNYAPATNYGGRNYNYGPTTIYGGSNRNYAPATRGSSGSEWVNPFTGR